MRMIGQIDNERLAVSFRDYLLVQGIENQLEREADGKWSVWVHADDELERATRYLADFRIHPEDSRFHLASSQAAELRGREKADQAAFEKRFHDRRQVFSDPGGFSMGPLTLALIGACVLVFFYSDFARDLRPVAPLFISEQGLRAGPWAPAHFLPEVREGQVWRLVTPIFLHFHIAHILFNLLWLRDLGSMIESRTSSLFLGLLVLAVGVISNVAQFVVSGPSFGGMSGVVYGLMGYIWIRGRLDPFCGLFLHRTTVTMMLIWFFACLFGLIPHIANTVHGVGLLVGMLWGYLDAKR